MSHAPTIHSSRLTYRAYRAEDVESLYAIQRDRDAMRFTHAATSLEECGRWHQAYEGSRSRLGFAPWVVSSRDDDAIVGWGGLNVDPFDPGWGIEITYFFDRAHWGRGFATELVQMSLRHAFDDLTLSRVGAFVMPENGASIRVLEKCGFAFVRYEPRLSRNYYAAEQLASRSGAR